MLSRCCLFLIYETGFSGCLHAVALRQARIPARRNLDIIIYAYVASRSHQESPVTRFDDYLQRLVTAMRNASAVFACAATFAAYARAEPASAAYLERGFWRSLSGASGAIYVRYNERAELKRRREALLLLLGR